ncbi:hypothetical protein KCP74_02610 [Salmonella enterica subsp. enterica]|nr:hypothetical protein KCP74_02610 [Salmonella enterica subsp. enterica]
MCCLERADEEMKNWKTVASPFVSVCCCLKLSADRLIITVAALTRVARVARNAIGTVIGPAYEDKIGTS